MTHLELDPFGTQVCRLLVQRSFQPYPVGGYVRDLILQRPPVDVDIGVPHEGRRAARILADAMGGTYYSLDEETDTGRAIVTWEGQRHIVDVARWRGRTLDEDLSDRDFTINAMALDLTTSPPTLVDPFHGQRDLERRLIRMLRTEVFLQDPVRLLRAPRLCAQLGFTLDRETEIALNTFASLINRAPAERVRDELVRLMRAPDTASWLQFLDATGLLEPILPEVKELQGIPQPPPHYLPLYEHTLETLRYTEWVLDFLEARAEPQKRAEVLVAEVLTPWREHLRTHLAQDLSAVRTRKDFLKWGALAHDWGKPKTYRVNDRGHIVFYNHERVGAAITGDAMRRLRLSRREVEHMVTIVRHHMRPFALIRQVAREQQETPSRRAVFRFFRDAGDAGVDILLINIADDWATHGPRLRMGYWHKRLSLLPHLFDAYFNRRNEVVRPRPILRGRELMDTLGLESGPLLGRLLNALVEAQAVGEVRTRSEALRWARQWVATAPPQDATPGNEEEPEE